MLVASSVLVYDGARRSGMNNTHIYIIVIQEPIYCFCTLSDCVCSKKTKILNLKPCGKTRGHNFANQYYAIGPCVFVIHYLRLLLFCYAISAFHHRYEYLLNLILHVFTHSNVLHYLSQTTYNRPSWVACSPLNQHKEAFIPVAAEVSHLFTYRNITKHVNL